MFKKKKGFTLLESLLVLTIAGITATMAVQQNQQQFQQNLAKITGEQLAQIGKATNAYITHNYSDWTGQKGQNASSLSASQPGGPRTCYSDGTCQITVQTLVQNGFLPKWNPNLVNPLNSPYEIIIKKSTLAQSAMPLMSSLVVTKQPYTPTGSTSNINYTMLGQAVQAAGSQAGYSRSMGSCTSTSICGYGGSFQVSGSQYHNIVTQSGQLGYYTGISQGFLNDEYLRRDGTLPMYGNLYMGEHDIKNVRRIQGSETHHHEPSPNNNQTNPRSSLRMGNVQVSTNPKDLPKVNAKPQFATAKNVPTLLRGNVSVTANKTTISKDNKPGNSNFIAVFRQNPSSGQTAFAVGSNAKSTFNNQTKQSVTMKGGLHFKGNGIAGSGTPESITRGSDGLNASSGSAYDNNYNNFSGYNGQTPVNVLDSLSVAGVITNSASYGSKDGVNIMDNNYIDLTAHNSSAGGALQKPGSSYYLSTKPSQGWVNIGGNQHYSGSQTGLTVKNGPVFVGGSNSCNYTSYTANNQCQNNSSTYPKSGQVSAKDYYVKNYSQPNTPLSIILSHMNQRINRNAQNIASNSNRISSNRNSINNIGVIQGPPGPQGPRGPRGPPGPPGSSGGSGSSSFLNHIIGKASLNSIAYTNVTWVSSSYYQSCPPNQNMYAATVSNPQNYYKGTKQSYGSHTKYFFTSTYNGQAEWFVFCK